MQILTARGCDSPSTQNVMIATPSYGGICPEYVVSLYSSSTALTEAGIKNEVLIFSGNCHVDDCRNSIVKEFLRTDCTDLVFIDSDQRFRPQDLISLLKIDREVVGGAPKLKQEKEAYAAKLFLGDINAESDGVIEVEAVGTGFLKIQRSALEKLAREATKYKDNGFEDETPLIFERSVDGVRRWGGDYTFCKKWSAMGGKIYIDPNFIFGHIGNSEWKGCIAEYLLRENGLIDTYIEGVLNKLSSGSEIDFELLRSAWNNEWSAGVDYLTTLAFLAKEAAEPILECGSGLTTLVLGAITKQPIYVLEQEEEHALNAQKWVNKMGWSHVHIYHAPIKQYEDFKWFEIPDDLPHFGLVLCDAPRRIDGRVGLVPMMKDNFKKGCKILIDDLETEIEVVKEWGFPYKVVTKNVAVVEV